MAKSLRVEIIGDARSYARSLGTATSETTSFGSRVGGAFAALGKAALVAGAAAGAFAVVLGKKSVDAAIGAQEANDKLTQAFKNQKIQLDANSPAVVNLEEASRKLGFSNEDTRAGLLKLVNAGKSYGDATKEMTVAQDLARVSGQSLGDSTTALIRLQAGNTRAAKQYGIVLPPVTKNVDALKASHADLTTAQGKQLLAMAKVQDKLATGQAYYDALTKKVKDQAKVFADSAAGGIAKFHAAMGNLEEQIGAHVIPVLGRVAGAVGDFVNRLSAAQGIHAKLMVVWEGIQSVAQGLTSALGQAIGSIDWQAAWASAQGIAEGLAARLSAVDWSSVGQAIGDGIAAAIATAVTAGQKLADALRGIFNSIDWIALGRAAGPGLAAALATAFVTLLDPSFWIHNWDLALSIALVAFGGSVGRIAGRLGLLLAKPFEDAVLLLGVELERLSPALADAVVRGFLALPGLVAKALAPLENIVTSLFGRLSAVSQFVVKVLGVDIAINAIVQLGARVGQVFAGLAHTIGAGLDSAWASLREGALRAAAAIIEPFTHLPGILGGGIFQRAAAAIQAQLDKIDAKKVAAKITTDFNSASGKAKAAGGNLAMQAAAGIAAVGPHLEAVGKAGGGKAVAGVTSVTGAARAGGAGIGAAVGAGFVAGISAWAQAMANAAVAPVLAAVAAARAALGAKSPSKVMAEVGKDFMAGLVAGIVASEGLATGAAAQAAQKTAAAGKAALILQSPTFVAAAKLLGLDTAKGIVMGLLQGTPGIVGQAKLALQQGMAAARQAVVDARSSFTSAFNDLANSALGAFDARMSAWKPPSQRILDKMALQDQIKPAIDALGAAMAEIGGGGAAAAADMAEKLGTNIGDSIASAISQIAGAKTEAALNSVSAAAQQQVTQAINQAALPAVQAAQAAVDAARAQLVTAEAGGDPAAIAAAKQALDTAVANALAIDTAIRAEVESATTQLVAAEQTRHDQIAAKQREGLARQLAELRTELLKHPQEWNTMGAKVQAILASYNVRLQAAGHLWAQKFGDGIRAGIPAAVAAAQALASAVAAVLPSTSSPLKPAKEGPLSFHPYKMGQQWASSLGAGLAAGRLTGHMGSMTGGGTMRATGAAAGGGGNVYVTVQGALLGSSVPEVTETIRRELYRVKGRNSSLEF